MALADDVFMSSNHIVSTKSYNIYFYLKKRIAVRFSIWPSSKHQIRFNLSVFEKFYPCSVLLKVYQDMIP